MASRPVFAAARKRPGADVYMTDFVWNSGLSVSQKQKNIVAIHGAFNRRFPEMKVLEISSKSLQPLGVKLSAFNLTKFVPELGAEVPVECVYQGGKVFAAGGPYTDLYTATARQAKKDPRLSSSGVLRGFRFDGKEFPLNPPTGFYNWLYISALKEHPELAAELLQYDAFSDIEFAPDRGISCQAQAAAIFVSLHRQRLLEGCDSFEKFTALVK